jgi:hypothetical protein
MLALKRLLLVIFVLAAMRFDSSALLGNDRFARRDK